jgi:hypothetical protein
MGAGDMNPDELFQQLADEYRQHLLSMSLSQLIMECLSKHHFRPADLADRASIVEEVLSRLRVTWDAK